MAETLSEGVTAPEYLDAATAPLEPPAPPPDHASEGPPGSIPDADDEGPPGSIPEPDPEEEEARKDTEVQRLFEDALTTQPDAHARILKLTALTGIPSDIVEGNEADLEQSWQASQFNARKWRKDNPGLAELVLNSPSHAPLVMHDEQLSSLVRELKAAWRVWSYFSDAADRGNKGFTPEEFAKLEPPALYDAPKKVPYLESPLASSDAWTKPLQVLREEYGQGTKQVELSRLNFRIMRDKALRRDTWELEKQAADLQTQLVPHYYGDGEFSKLMRDVGSLAPSQVTSLEAGGVGAVTGGAVGTALGGAFAYATEKPEFVAKGARMGFTWGGRAGVALATFELESGSAYGDMANVRTDEGKPIPDDLRIGYAVAYGITATAIEMGAMPVVLGKLGPLGDALAKGEGRAFMAAALKDPSVVRILKDVGAAWLKGSTAEAGQEAAQQAAQNLFSYLARTNAASLQHGRLEPQVPDVAGGVQDIALTFEQTLRGSLGSGPATMAVHASQEFMQRDRALRAQAQVKALLTAGKESVTVKAAPSVVAQLIERETGKDGPPVTHAYVDAKAFAKFFQEAKADPEDAAEELMGPGGKEKLQAAVAKAGKLEVPISEYMEKWVSRPIAEALVRDTTTQPGFETANELAATEKERKAQVQAILKQFDGGKQVAPESDAEQRYGTALAQQLLNTGKYDNLADAEAATMPARLFIRVQAAKFGLSPDELFANEEIAVQRAAPPDTSFDFGGGEGGGEGGAAPTAAQGAAPSGIEEAKALISRMANPEKKAMAQAWLEYTQNVTDKRPTVTPELERELARYGVVDPAGYGFDEFGRSLERELGGRRSTGAAQPDSLREHRLRSQDRNGTLTAAEIASRPLGNRFEQRPVGPEASDILSERTLAASPEELAKDVYVDPVSGLLNRKGWDETPRQPGKPVAIITTTDIKAINDDPAGGHDTANELLRTIGAVVGTFDAEAARSGTNFLFHIQDEGDLNAALELVQKSLPDQRLRVAGATGASLDEAFRALDEKTDAMRASGELPARGKTAFDLKQLPTLRFPEGRAESQLPGHLLERVGSLSPEDLFRKAYEDQDVPGILSAAGWHNIPRKAHVAALDLRGLKEVNRISERLGRGKELGDKILRLFGEAARELGGSDFDFTHLSGDEYALQHNDAGELQRYLADLSTALHDVGVDATVDGVEVHLRARFRYGIGEKSYGAADRDLNRRKLNEAEAGDVPGRAGGLPGRESRGEGGARPGDVEGSAGGEGRPAAPRGRGALPQAFRDRRAGGREEVAPGKTRGETLSQDDEGGPRGYVEFLQEGAKRIAQVVLNDNADLSTFLHESGHVFLDITERIAARADAPESVKRDWATIQKYLGAEEGKPFTREQHEKFARTFEAYLYEGKAPSVALVRAFTRFRLWLRQVYRSLQSLNVELSPEIRGVLDRMFATDEEIAQAARAAGLKPLFRSPEEAGLSPEEWRSLQDAQEKTFAHATMAATHRVVREQLRETERWWKDELKRKRIEAEGDYEKLPVNRAWAYVRKGTLPLEDGRTVDAPEMGKLDRAAVVELVGKERAKAFGNRLVKEGGEHPDALVGIFRDASGEPVFPTGKALLEAMLAVPERKAWVEEHAQAAMRQAHPDILEEKEKLAELAQKGVHGDYSQEWLLREYQALREKAYVLAENPEANAVQAIPKERLGMKPPSAKSFQDAARLLVERERVGALRPGVALQAERNASERAFKAAAEEDWALALVHKQQQVLQHFLYRHLVEARDERDSFETLLSGLAKEKKRGELGKAAPVFRDTADQVLEALGVKAAPAGPEARASFEDYLQRLEQDGLAPAFDVEALRDVLAKQVVWSNLTVTQMRNVSAALKQLRTAARDTNTVLTQGKRVALAQLVDTVALEASSRSEVEKPPAAETAASATYSLKQGVVSLNATMLDPELIIRKLGKTAHNFLWRGFIRARNAEAKLAQDVLKYFAEKWDSLPPEMQARRYDVIANPLPLPERVGRLPVQDRLWAYMVALNMGNASNKERLLGGYGWTEDQVLTWLRDEVKLSKEEWGFLQGIWDLLDKELWPQVAKQYEDVNGVPPKKIDASPIDTPFGPMRGGYFPAKYDPLSARAAAQQEAQVGLVDAQARASVMRSFTKERVDNYEDVVSLQWGAFPSHVAGVVHYVTHDSFVRDANRFLSNDTMRRTTQERLGIPYLQQLEGWLKAVANQQSDPMPQHLRVLGSILSWSKSRLVMAAMGHSMTVFLGDLTNPLVAMAAGGQAGVSARYLSPILAKLINPFTYRALREEALAKSEEVRFRGEAWRKHFNRNLSEVGAGGKKGRAGHVLEQVRETADYLNEFSDRLSSTLIWQGAYRQAMGEGLDEAGAVQAADDKLRGLQPGTSPGEQPSLLRDKRSVGSLIAFYGYFSKLYNVLGRVWEEPLSEWDAAEGTSLQKAGAVALPVTKAAAHTLAVFFAASVLSEFLSGRGPEPEETYPEWVLRKMATAPFSLVPLFGQVLEPVMTRLVTGKKHPVNARAAPVVSGFERVFDALGRAADENRETDARVFDLLEGLGVLARLPVSQPRRTLEYGERVLVGKESPQDPLEALSGLIYGKPRKNQPANPLTEGSKALR